MGKLEFHNFEDPEIGYIDYEKEKEIKIYIKLIFLISLKIQDLERNGENDYHLSLEILVKEYYFLNLETIQVYSVIKLKSQHEDALKIVQILEYTKYRVNDNQSWSRHLLMIEIVPWN